MITAKEARNKTISHDSKDLLDFIMEMQTLEELVTNAAAKGKSVIEYKLSDWAKRQLFDLGYSVELLGGGKGIYIISWK